VFPNGDHDVICSRNGHRLLPLHLSERSRIKVVGQEIGDLYHLAQLYGTMCRRTNHYRPETVG
jgi:hypothetical protein